MSSNRNHQNPPTIDLASRDSARNLASVANSLLRQHQIASPHFRFPRKPEGQNPAAPAVGQAGTATASSPPEAETASAAPRVENGAGLSQSVQLPPSAERPGVRLRVDPPHAGVPQTHLPRSVVEQYLGWSEVSASVYEIHPAPETSSVPAPVAGVAPRTGNATERSSEPAAIIPAPPVSLATTQPVARVADEELVNDRIVAHALPLSDLKYRFDRGREPFGRAMPTLVSANPETIPGHQRSEVEPRNQSAHKPEGRALPPAGTSHPTTSSPVQSPLVSPEEAGTANLAGDVPGAARTSSQRGPKASINSLEPSAEKRLASKNRIRVSPPGTAVPVESRTTGKGDTVDRQVGAATSAAAAASSPELSGSILVTATAENSGVVVTPIRTVDTAAGGPHRLAAVRDRQPAQRPMTVEAGSAGVSTAKEPDQASPDRKQQFESIPLFPEPAWPMVTDLLLGAGWPFISRMAEGMDRIMAGRTSRIILSGVDRAVGTTTIAVALARWAAAAKRKVLVVDADLQAAGLSRILGRNPARLWPAAGRGADFVRYGLVRSSRSGIAFATTGALKNRQLWPPFVLNRLGELLDSIEGLFDLVLVDAGPVHQVVAELTSMDRLSPCTLLVSGGSASEEPLVQSACQRLGELGVQRILAARNFSASPLRNQAA